MILLPHLETNVTQACQNSCVGCNHFVILSRARGEFKSSMLDPAALERDLGYFSKLCHVEGYAMIGGEPTLHPALADLLLVAKRSGVADVLEVWSNGQDIDGGESWWVYADKLVVSRYPGKLTDDEVAALAHHCLYHGVELRVVDETTVPNFSRLLTKDASDEGTRQRWESCFFRNYSRVLDHGYFFRCCTSPYIPRLLQGRSFGDDGLRIDENTTEQELARFLARTEPMESCRVCHGRSGRGEPLAWREERDPAKWLEASGLA